MSKFKVYQKYRNCRERQLGIEVPIPGYLGSYPILYPDDMKKSVKDTIDLFAEYWQVNWTCIFVTLDTTD